MFCFVFPELLALLAKKGGSIAAVRARRRVCCARCRYARTAWGFPAGRRAGEHDVVVGTRGGPACGWWLFGPHPPSAHAPAARGPSRRLPLWLARVSPFYCSREAGVFNVGRALRWGVGEVLRRGVDGREYIRFWQGALPARMRIALHVWRCILTAHFHSLTRRACTPRACLHARL